MSGPGVVHVYPVGVLQDLRHAWRLRQPRHLLRSVRYIRYWAHRHDWRAVRNTFNGYLAECEGHHHNAGRGWTKRAARRRVERICRRAHQ